MFHSGYWAAAFINSLEKQGGNIEDGIDALGTLAAGLKSLPGPVFGFCAAEKIERLIRKGIAQSAAFSESGAPGTLEAMPGALEAAIRFLALMVRKNALRHIDSVLDKAREIMNKKRGIVSAYLESAASVTEDVEARIKEAIVKRSGAAGVDIRKQLNAELIGGYRLRIEDKIIDASVRFQLRKLMIALQNDHAANAPFSMEKINA